MELSVHEARVLVLAPTRADAEVTLRVLKEAGVTGDICATDSELAREIQRGAGAVILTDDFPSGSFRSELGVLLERQPSWSELPILMLARADSPRSPALRSVPGVVLLERPVHVRSMVSAVQAALRARLRQYQLRNQLDQTRAVNNELKEAAQAKDDFLATLSHELRNPLSALRSAADLLEHGTLPAEADANARKIVKRQAVLMGRLLDDLLDVARITRGRLEIRVTRAPLSAIVRSAVETVQPLLDRKHHAFSLTMPDEDLMLDADPVRLAQVLANLLTNAAKYTEAHGAISLVAAREEGAVIFRVRDNGIGIAPESAPYIFDMFAQLKPALERSEGGLGIGLALAKGLVDLHGGKLTVSSEGLGRGSEFVVSLPLHHVVPTQVSADAGQGPGCGKESCDIIIADDNADALESLAMLLELEGHHVRTAADGAAALAHLQERMPDVMLLDIGMPGMNGYEVARKAREARGAVTLIALTGWGQPNDRLRAREAGFDHHLTKPVEFTELEKLLTKQRSSKRERPPLRAVNT